MFYRRDLLTCQVLSSSRMALCRNIDISLNLKKASHNNTFFLYFVSLSSSKMLLLVTEVFSK